jgi:hypothetical protein
MPDRKKSIDAPHGVYAVPRAWAPFSRGRFRPAKPGSELSGASTSRAASDGRIATPCLRLPTSGKRSSFCCSRFRVRRRGVTRPLRTPPSGRLLQQPGQLGVPGYCLSSCRNRSTALWDASSSTPAMSWGGLILAQVCMLLPAVGLLADALHGRRDDPARACGAEPPSA